MAVGVLLIGRHLSGNNKKLYDCFTTFVVILSFRRSHDSEADYLGLVFINFEGF
tara:strand:+ start:649 stop:810 length:162 start_codon:yes stop_codon:yes gene_type:complete